MICALNVKVIKTTSTNRKLNISNPNENSKPIFCYGFADFRKKSFKEGLTKCKR